MLSNVSPWRTRRSRVISTDFPHHRDSRAFASCVCVLSRMNSGSPNEAQSRLVARAEHWRLERPVGEDAWRRCDQGHLSALASGTPRGLDRSRECAAKREGIRRVRVSIERGRPFGEDEWVKRTASELRLEHTIRPEGRPPKPRK